MKHKNRSNDNRTRSIQHQLNQTILFAWMHARTDFDYVMAAHRAPERGSGRTPIPYPYVHARDRIVKWPVSWSELEPGIIPPTPRLTARAMASGQPLWQWAFKQPLREPADGCDRSDADAGQSDGVFLPECTSPSESAGALVGGGSRYHRAAAKHCSSHPQLWSR